MYFFFIFYAYSLFQFVKKGVKTANKALNGLLKYTTSPKPGTNYPFGTHHNQISFDMESRKSQKQINLNMESIKVFSNIISSILRKLSHVVWPLLLIFKKISHALQIVFWIIFIKNRKKEVLPKNILFLFVDCPLFYS